MGGAPLPPVARHLGDQRPLAVHDLVVGDRQDVVLAVRVDHGEGHLAVVVLAVHRLLGDVLQRVVHPAHVPLQAEAEAAEAAGAHVVGGAGDAVPGGGLLGDGDDAGAAAVDGGVHLLQEGHGVEVLAAAVLVGRPLAGLAGVVEVEHRGDGVHAQAVDVELLAPVDRVGDEEVADLGAAVVELQRAPVRVRGPQRVLVLVERAAVELGQGPVVAREVRRHPVHQHADARPVQGVDQVLEIVGRAEPRGRRVEAGDLITPRAAEGVLGDRHQLDVREAEVLDVRGQLLGQLPVGQAGTPGRQVHLVDGEGRLVHRPRAPLLLPRAVAPDVVRGVHDRGGGRRRLGAPGHRVGAHRERAVGPGDLELVQRALADARQEQLPHPRAAQRAHRMGRAVPVVEVADHAHAPGVGRPDGEAGALDALVGHRVRAQRVPQLLVPALADQVQVQLAEGGQEAVRVVDLDLVVVVRDEEAVAVRDRGEGQHRREEAAALGPQLRAQSLRRDRHRARVGAQGAEEDPAGDGVRPQHAVRVVVRAVQQARARVLVQRLRSPHRPAAGRRGVSRAAARRRPRGRRDGPLPARGGGQEGGGHVPAPAGRRRRGRGRGWRRRR